MAVIWNADNAAHLLRRATFSATPKEVSAAVTAGMAATIVGLFATPETDALTTTNLPFKGAQAWWLRRMLVTKAPLVEKLTLMWHNHFATGNDKVRNVLYMHMQNRLIRQYCLGNFNTLTAGVCKSAAMLIWLDGWNNTLVKPNQNLARELMECFTTGVYDKTGAPIYTQMDVVEAARSLTGWSYVGATGANKFIPRNHDTGLKTFRGSTGNFVGEDIVLQLCQDVTTARRVAWRLWNTFAYPVDLADPVLDALEAVYLANNMELKPVVQYLFSCDAFYTSTAKFAHVKSPCEWLIGSMRHLGMQFSNTPAVLSAINASIADTIQNLGQSLFDPPSVFGWDEGLAWLNSNSLVNRLVIGETMVLDPRDMLYRHFVWAPATLLPPAATWPTYTADKILTWVQNQMGYTALNPGTAAQTAFLNYLNTNDAGLPQPFALNASTADSKIRGLVALILACPEYQYS